MLLLAASVAWTREGFVRTLDGRVLDGHVRFESNVVIVVNIAQGFRAEVALTNLAGMAFAVESDGMSAGLSAASKGVELPSPWASVDVGSVRHSGEVEYSRGAFHVRATGTNILAESDSFHFVFKKITGPSELMARVTQVQLTDPWARAGLMMRESLAADSRNVFLAASAGRGGVFQWRERLAESTTMRPARGLAPGHWLKLRRDGDVFTAMKSINGRQWTTVERLSMRATRELYVGLAVVGVREEKLNHSVFQDVDEGPSLRNRTFVPQIELQGGSMQRGYLSRMDDTAFYFEPASLRVPVSSLTVANVRFQPLPSRLASVVNAGRPGVLLTTGEFVDGECRGIEDGRVVLSSVPLGLCRYDVNREVVALVLQKRRPPMRHPYEVITGDGSVWQGIEVVLDEGGVTLREPTLGLRRIPAHDVVELRRRS